MNQQPDGTTMGSVDILAAIDAAVGCQQCGGELGDSPSDDFCREACLRAWRAQHVEPLVGYREPWDRPWDFPGIGTEAHVIGDARPGRVRGGDVGMVFVDEAHHWRLPPTAIQPAIRWGSVQPRRASWLPAQAQFALAGLIHTPEVGFSLPRSTGDMLADWHALGRAERAASTDAQWAACTLRRASLNERAAAVWDPVRVEMSQAYDRFTENIRATWESICRSLNAVATRRFLDQRTYPTQMRGTCADDPARGDVMDQALQARRNRNTGPPRRERAPRSIGRPSSSGR